VFIVSSERHGTVSTVGLDGSTRLEQDRLLTSAWREGDGGPGRKFFSVTLVGRAALQDRTASWLVFAERATGLLTSGSVAA
jgi:DNA-binding PadR family transcriptional regulator